VLLAMSVASWVVIALEGALVHARVAGRRGALHGRVLAGALAGPWPQQRLAVF
jgi:hypothetical protein